MATHSFGELMMALAFSEFPDSWPAEWEAAMATFPGEVPFLADAFISASSGFCAHPADIRAVLREAAARVREDGELSRLAWFLHHLYHRDPMPPGPEVFAWPCVCNPLPERAAMIPALVLLAGVPRLWAMHEERGIPNEVTCATLRDIEIWLRHFQRAQGYWGLQNMGWPTNHFSGRLFRIGRLQFMHVKYTGPMRVFTHRQSGRVVALWNGEAKIRRDGYVDGTNEVFDEQARVPEFALTDEAASGYPIHPLGCVQPEKVTLPLAEWQPALLQGDPVLDIHIPEDGKMDFAECGESLRQAREFFEYYFPERPAAVAFVCGTWFFDAQYRQMLPPTSNIVRFQREFYLHPLLSYEREPLWRVFGCVPEDLSAAPRDTALRRGMLDFKQAGGQLRCAGGCCLIEGMAWDGQRYQREKT